MAKSKPKAEPMKAFELKAFYSIPELARMAGVSRHRMARLLASHDVNVVKNSYRWLVPLSEINEKMHWLRESMETRDMFLDSMAGQLPSR